jgi:GTP-dependent phosphoenolpyruvate carboxykinase
LVRNPEGVELLLRPGKDRRLVSKWFLKKQGRRVWPGFTCSDQWIQWIFGFHKMLDIRGVAVSLTDSQERLSS